MNRATGEQQPLFDAWLPWQQFPDPVRERVLEVLTTLYLETLDLSQKESEPDDTHDP